MQNRKIEMPEARVAVMPGDTSEARDASVLFAESGPDQFEFPASYTAVDRQPGDMPTLTPGAYGGITQFMTECRMWGFDPVTEGPARCDDQFGMTELVKTGINMGMLSCHSASVYAGWWHDKETGELLDQAYHIPIKLMLIVSEISEAMEGDRKQLMDDKLPHRPMFEVELADAYIRLMDLAGATQCDLAGAVVEKMAFNRDRADHQLENRVAAGGKGY